MSGWIKIHRKMTEWGWYQDQPTKIVFLHLLLLASRKPMHYCGNKLGAGDIVTGRNKISSELGITEKQVRRALSNLEKTGEISRKRASKYSIITINNYCKYQTTEDAPGPAEGQQRASRGPLNKNIKNIRSKNTTNTIGGFKRPTVDDVAEYCKQRGNNVDHEKWFDHYTSNGWMVGKNKMKDWRAAVRTWERSQFNKNGKPYGKHAINDEIQDIGSIINEQTGFNPYAIIETGNSSRDADKNIRALPELRPHGEDSEDSR